MMEFMALSNHRKSIRSELAEFAEQFRRNQLETLAGHLDEYGLDPDEVPPEVLLVAIAGISRAIVMEESLGMETGLAETIAFVEKHLERIEGPAEQAPRSASSQPEFNPPRRRRPDDRDHHRARTPGKPFGHVVRAHVGRRRLWRGRPHHGEHLGRVRRGSIHHGPVLVEPVDDPRIDIGVAVSLHAAAQCASAKRRSSP